MPLEFNFTQNLASLFSYVLGLIERTPTIRRPTPTSHFLIMVRGCWNGVSEMISSSSLFLPFFFCYTICEAELCPITNLYLTFRTPGNSLCIVHRSEICWWDNKVALIGLLPTQDHPSLLKVPLFAPVKDEGARLTHLRGNLSDFTIWTS